MNAKNEEQSMTDFAGRVRVNQRKLASKLKSNYDFIVCGSGCASPKRRTIVSLRHFLGWLVSAFSFREDLVLENLALRRQLLALHTQQPRRRLCALHKLFWVALKTCWSGWRKPLVLATPRTVVGGVSYVLDMGLKSQTSRRTEAGQ
jgi:hypothetical protein